MPWQYCDPQLPFHPPGLTLIGVPSRLDVLLFHSACTVLHLFFSPFLDFSFLSPLVVLAGALN